MTTGIKETKLGSGITVTRRTTYDYGTKDGRAAVHADWRDGEFQITKTIERLEAWAESIFCKHGLTFRKNGREISGHEYDSMVGFAQRTLWVCFCLKHSMSKKNVEDVASNACELGAIIKELQLKVGWERSALHGQRMRQSGAPNLARRNKRVSAKQESKWTAWQAEADRIWAKHPTWSALRVAAEVERNLGTEEKVETIRKRIKRK